ncbi:DUF1614 domain-containing protein [Selenihalanaerobacter shriftii]|uniref:Uncharacterized membrane protein n=1 Tax=Selenihalanaerobacter shriftii TaxID=142842 RepID=A0A1T4LHZ9_9FIRM|nr:DUF1614 domain-containing protein [Selenihalanaerobacter shriftii]SJZ54429.1 Uncharacterized membrane protein [Selenihalanaerobacter shriftii]
MPLGVIVLVVMAVLIYFGFAQRILDRMYLTDKQALLFIGLMVVGSFIDIPITTAPAISINIGGALLPVVLAIYVLSKADSTQEWLRTIFSIVVTGGVIYALTKIYQFEEGHTLLDPSYIFAIVAGVTAYITSRSRRNAFISGTLGFLLYDLIHVWNITFGGVPGQADIGGAGALDTIVTSGFIAVLLAEVVGESRERLQGGTAHKEHNDRGRDEDSGEDEKKLDNVEYADFLSGKIKKRKKKRGEDDE